MSYNRLAAAKAGGTIVGVVGGVILFVLAQIYFAKIFWFSALVFAIILGVTTLAVVAFKSLYAYYSKTPYERSQEKARELHIFESTYGYCRSSAACGWEGHK